MPATPEREANIPRRGVAMETRPTPVGRLPGAPRLPPRAPGHIYSPFPSVRRMATASGTTAATLPRRPGRPFGLSMAFVAAHGYQEPTSLPRRLPEASRLLLRALGIAERAAAGGSGSGFGSGSSAEVEAAASAHADVLYSLGCLKLVARELEESEHFLLRALRDVEDRVRRVACAGPCGVMMRARRVCALPVAGSVGR